ncbi:hypothetical protein EPR50_G00061720 [Perca flavescens]|uniref:Domain of unknown function with conserved HDNR motif domain-containing protein n=1 Tax=Perca flavescens TaxID=8167 RepID=A0A484DAC7_PERFV|nr:uncharacterized protein LOC114557162 [Perca flavescens]TDH11520.1 hypothetical protein EPR50_G00061720 [Perca flavescens]
MTAGMCVPLVVFLSAIVLHPVSAGGVYCAKTARARAAALGLDYPGVHGAPGLYGPAHHGMPPSRLPFRPQPYNNNYPQLDETESNMASYRQSQPEVRSLYDRTHKRAHPRSWHRTYNPGQSEYTTNQVLSLIRGWSVINRKPNFEEVKHVAPPTQAEAPGQPELMNWPPKGRKNPFSFVHNEHDFGVDESVPNGRGIFLSGLPPKQGSWRLPEGSNWIWPAEKFLPWVHLASPTKAMSKQ